MLDSDECRKEPDSYIDASMMFAKNGLGSKYNAGSRNISIHLTTRNKVILPSCPRKSAEE